MILVDETTSLKYKLHTTKEEEESIILYDPIEHGDLWLYVTINGLMYTNGPLLVDWDADVQEWNSGSMAQWPFSAPLLEQDQDDDNDDDVYYETEDKGCTSDVEDYAEDQWPMNFGIAPVLQCILL